VKGDNVKKAAKQLSSCLSWRQNFDIERLGAEEFSTELSDGVAYISGHDRESRPVIIFRFKHDYQKLHTQKQFTRLVAFTIETAISSMSRNTEQSFVLLFDASFFRSSSAFANLLLATLKIIADNYPCRLYKAFIIDPPSFFLLPLEGCSSFCGALNGHDDTVVSRLRRTARYHPRVIKSSINIFKIRRIVD
jgi:hypothetical protein